MMDFREQRRIAREQRRAYRRQMRYGGYYGGISGIIWPLAIVLFIFTHNWIWFPLAIFAPMILAGIFNAGRMSQQQFYNPPAHQQPEQPVYQPQEQPPAYEPYTQGYTPQQPAQQHPEIYQEGGQQYQYPAQQQQQYEEPMTMYPEE